MCPMEKLWTIQMLKLWTQGMCHQATSILLLCLTFTNILMKGLLERWRGCHFTPLLFYNRPMVQPNHAVLHKFDGTEIDFFVIACNMTCSIYVYRNALSKKVRNTLFVKRRHFYLVFQVSLKVKGL